MWRHFRFLCLIGVYAVDALRNAPADRHASIFFVVDTMRESTDLQRAARDTWLKHARRAGHDYRFFILTQQNDSASLGLKRDPSSSDTILVPKLKWPHNRHLREFYLLRAAFAWALEHTTADFVVKADHDTYVCTRHLQRVLQAAPWSQFFLGFYWQKPAGCRADQNFLVYSRDALATAVNITETLDQSRWKLNWAMTWGRIAKHLYANGRLQIVDDFARIDSQQRYHTRPGTDPLPEDYCQQRLAMHIYPAMNAVSAPKVMHQLSSLEKGLDISFLTSEPESVRRSHLGPPRCVEGASQECKEDWEKC
mmetsp:Transcript_40847/g.127082  ORF Transcript_40847/g.127082 Transcript_40847/m.127082 type:complete len:309 (+) Transcript_40847:143-1069(+)